MVNNQGTISGLLQWQSKSVQTYTIGGVVAVAIYTIFEQWLGWVHIALPTLPLAIVGGALGIFVSFRTNSAYDRWWEGRKLWGRLINTSRHWSSQVATYVKDPELQKELIGRHVAYVHILRCLLRTENPLADETVQEWTTEADREWLATQSNQTHALLQRQLEAVVALADAGQLDERRLQSMEESVRHLLDIQGGCERIKKTPLPRGYGYIAEQLILALSFLLPLAIVADLHLLAIPVNILVCLAFALISEAGRVLEDPFTTFWNGLPLTNMSDTIEQNLRNRLGEDKLEPLPGPDYRGILM
jgi:ion channel-forming bestrophin family protein